MLNDIQLEDWFGRLQIGDQTRAIIHQIRISDPARRVGGGRRNVSGRYPSRKMGVTIQFESHRVELAEIYAMEHDPACLEYYDQPPPIKLEYQSLSGKQVGVLHTADYFAIRTDGAGWVECKTEDDLCRLAAESPNRYRLAGDRWSCVPGEAYAGHVGLSYRIRSSREINWIFQENAQFLDDYLRGSSEVPSHAIEKIRAYIGALPGITLEELLSGVQSYCSRDQIYILIAQGQLGVDLNRARLSEPDTVQIFANQQMLQTPAQPRTTVQRTGPAPIPTAGSTITWNGRIWKVLNIGVDVVSLSRDDQTVLECPRSVFEHLGREGSIAWVSGPKASSANPELVNRLLHANEGELRKANHRYECVMRFLQRDHDNLSTPSRTLRRWTVQYREAERNLGSGFLGLFSNTAKRGNCTRKLPDATLSLMAEFIAGEYETLKQKNRRICWMALSRECEKRGIPAPSYKTFCIAVHMRPPVEQITKRRGHRAAYEVEPFYWTLERMTPRHGVRPFEVGHIDHTELDIELVCSVTGRVLGRPWLTLMSDAFSRRCLAFYLTFESPSYRSCMMVLRECVHRHSRLPQIVVVDGGHEFDSTYFETLLARYECTKKSRPPAKARFGSVCERLFGTANTQLIHNLRGNTQITRDVRQTTKSNNPKNLAVWSLRELQERLSDYCYDAYDSIDHPALGQSPREAYEAGMAAGGQRTHRVIPYDREFLIYTLPTTAKGTAKVLAGRGVKVNYLYYWCELFRDSRFTDARVDIRYDPFDLGTIHAFLNNQWVECHSEHYHAFHGRSLKEVRLAAQEFKKRSRNHSANSCLTATKLMELLAATEAQETVLAQRRADMEAREAESAASGLPLPQPSGTWSLSDHATLNAVSAEIYEEF